MNSNKLILLHGALGSQLQLMGLKAHLGHQFEVFSFDFEGHGSFASNKEFSIEGFAENLMHFIRINQLENCHIFGYSMGGYVALYLASQGDKTIKSVNTFGTKFHWNPKSAAMEVKMLDPDIIAEKVPRHAEHLRTIHSHNDWRAVLENTAQMMLSLGENPRLNEGTLQSIEIPVLINIGDQDQMVSIDESQQTTDALKNGSLNILKGFQHPLEKNDLAHLSQIISNFISSQN